MNNLIISTLDYQRLKQRVEQPKIASKLSSNQLVKLLISLDRANLFDPNTIPADVVTMNSVVKLTYMGSDKTVTLRLAYPEEADNKQNRISIGAPLATALLGRKLGSVVSIPTPLGSVSVKISHILYQPEAAGDFSL